MLAAGQGPDGVGNGKPPNGAPEELGPLEYEDLDTSPGTPAPKPPVMDRYTPVDVAVPRPTGRRSILSPHERNLRLAVARLLGTPSDPHSSMEGFTVLTSGSGAKAYVQFPEGKSLHIEGYIYDTVSLLHDILYGFEDRVKRMYRYTSPAGIVSDLEHAEALEGKFSNVEKNVTVTWTRVFDTAWYRLDIDIKARPTEADLQPFFDRFAALQTSDIMSATPSPVSLSGIRKRLKHLLGLAKAGNILEMLNSTDAGHDFINLGVRRQSSLYVRDVDVGIGIKDRTVASVIFFFNQGDSDDDDLRRIQSFNVSKWVGTPVGSRVLRWKITDTYGEKAKNADWRDHTSWPLRCLVRDLWGSDVVHVNADMEDVPIVRGGGTGTAPASGAPQGGNIGGFSPSGETPAGASSGSALGAPLQGASMVFVNAGRVSVFNPIIAGATGAAIFRGAVSSAPRYAAFL